MKNLRNIAIGAIMATGVALAATAPAEAGVSVGIGIGVPGPAPYWHGGWCYHHPYRCGRPYPAYYGDRPYFGWHGGYWGHRGWYHSHWHRWH